MLEFVSVSPVTAEQLSHFATEHHTDGSLDAACLLSPPLMRLNWFLERCFWLRLEGGEAPRFPGHQQRERGGETSCLPSWGPRDTVTGSQEEVVVVFPTFISPRKPSVHWKGRPVFYSHKSSERQWEGRWVEGLV